MYIMYSLVCCGTRKRIHNIDNCGIWFVCLVCCGARKRICICNANVLSKLMAVKNANRRATIDSGLVYVLV